MPYNYRSLPFLSFYFVLVIGYVSCKQDQQTTENQTQFQSTSESAEFQDFYKKFSTDSIFQIEHTVFPLEGMKSIKDSLDVPDPNFKWSLENWVIHKPYDDMNGTYSREWIDMPGLVVEKISDTSGQYTMERRFGKLSSGWHLIYYREMGRY